MEGSLSQGGGGGILQGGTCFGAFDFQAHHHHQAQHPHTMQHHPPHPRQGLSLHSSVHDGFALQNCDQTLSMTDYSKGERSKNSASEEDEPSFTEDGYDAHHEAGRGEDITSDGGGGGSGRRKFAVLQKKGKWKSVSKVMAERGYHVSPQQCEDKFNDLNKRYKKLNDMLGRGTSCQVVENPALLDVIDYLSEKEKDDVRKILSSKHLFYEEMCSYHNNNRLHLPHDPALQRSLHMALRNRDDPDNDDIRRSHLDDLDEDEQDADIDDHEDFKETGASHGDSRGIFRPLGVSMKKLKQSQGQEDANTFGTSSNCQDYNRSSYPHGQMGHPDVTQVLPESMRAAWLQKQWVDSRQVQLEEQKLQIQVEMLELEKQRFKWQRFSKKKDRELEKLSLENERMKLENERIALELKRKEMGIGSN